MFMDLGREQGDSPVCLVIGSRMPSLCSGVEDSCRKHIFRYVLPTQSRAWTSLFPLGSCGLPGPASAQGSPSYVENYPFEKSLEARGEWRLCSSSRVQHRHGAGRYLPLTGHETMAGVLKQVIEAGLEVPLCRPTSCTVPSL